MQLSQQSRIFGVSALLTLVLAVVVAVFGGVSDLWLFVVLVLLEITFSFDNAIVNSRILTRLNPWWQMLFLTVGIVFAVFIVRFLLPIIIVIIATGIDPMNVINLALHHPALYSADLYRAGPIINAFGGTFLLSIGLNYFLDREKDVHWLQQIEHGLAKVGQIRFIKLTVLLVVAAVLFFTVASNMRLAVILASVVAIALHLGLESSSTTSSLEKVPGNKKLAGKAAFSAFMYLQVLDASFSFDGVIGAFAITSSVLLIMAGLGAGALWVRSLTVYLVRTGTLTKYRYLEHGAHWAILVLGIVMLAKLYAIDLPQWLTGSLGLIFIGTALITSIVEKRTDAVASVKN